MKAKILLIALLFLSINLWSQENKNCPKCGKSDLIYDAKCKKFYFKEGKDTTKNEVTNLNKLKINYKKGFRFKIINLNKYLYQSTISFEDVVLSSEEPVLFKKLFLGEAFKFDELNLSQAASANGATNDSLQSNLDNFKEKLKEFKSQYNKLLEQYSIAYSLCPKDIKCCEEKRDSDDISYTKLKEALFDLKTAFDELDIQITSESEESESNVTEQKEKLTTLNEKLADATNEQEKVTIKREISIAKNDIIENEKLVSAAKKDKLRLDRLKAVLDGIDEEKLLELVHFYKNLISENFEYIAPTIYPTGDKLVLNVKIAPNTSDEAKKWQVMPLYDDEFELDLRVNRKWFYSFSTGPFVGIYNRFKTQEYGWQKQPDADGNISADSKYKLVEAGRQGLPVGIAGFANFGTKLNDFYGLGVSIGAGATILNDTRIGYFAGLNNFFGQDKQFNLTIGVAFIQVNELQKELYSGIGTQLYDEPIADLKYIKKFEAGFFASVTYSVFTSSKTKKASSTNTNEKAAAGKAKEDDKVKDKKGDEEKDSEEESETDEPKEKATKKGK